MADHEPPDNNSTEANSLSLPAKIRVHALAKLLGLTSKEIIAKAAELGTELRSAHSTLPREAAEELHTALSAQAEADTAAETQPQEPAAQEPAPAESPVVDAPEAEPLPDTPVLDDSETPAGDGPVVEAPVGGAAGLFAAPGGDTPLFDIPEPTPEPAVAPAVEAPLFLQPTAPQPEEEARPRRRRSRRGGPESAPQDTASQQTEKPDVAAAETDTGERAGAGTAAEQAEPETSADSTSDTAGSADEHEEHPRRRRRGRRGRGRGRSDSTEHDETSADTTTEKNTGEETAEGADAASTAGSAEAEPSGSDTGDAEDTGTAAEGASDESSGEEGASRRRRRRRRRRGSGDGSDTVSEDDPPNTVIHEREPRAKARAAKDEVQGISGSTRLEAKRQRRRDGREAGRRRPPILTESEFLARREAVERVMVVRERAAGAHAGMTQVAVLEDGILVEHFVTSAGSASMVGNIYLGRVQNVLPSMEAAFIDIGRGRNGVLYAGEVNWEAAGLGGNSRKIEQALKPGDQVVVQVSKDPVGHKGARLTTQISLAGRFLVYVPGGSSTGISRKLPDTERKRLKDILREIVPADAGVIIRTAAEGVSEEELARDVARLQSQWEAVRAHADKEQANASGQPKTLYEEPDLLVKVVRDLFNEDFSKLVIEGEKSWSTVENYIRTVAPDLLPRAEQYRSESSVDVFGAYRIDEQLAKALDRKVWLPSGGTLVIDRTEAMTVVDVNTGKFTGAGGNLEETVTRNNLEAAEEIVRQMRLRDIGGMIVVDFIDMVLESNRDLVLRRLTESLGRDRTRHQVSEVTSLGLVQMTRKRLGTGLVEAFSTTCEHCHGRGIIVHSDPVESKPAEESSRSSQGGSRRKRGRDKSQQDQGQNQNQHQHQNAEPAATHVSSEEAAKRAAHPVALAMAAHRGEEHPAESDGATPTADVSASGTTEHAPAKDVEVAAPVVEQVASEPKAEPTSESKSESKVEPTVEEGVEAAASTEASGTAVPDETGTAVPDEAVPEAGAAAEPASADGAPRRRRARRVSRAASAPAGDGAAAKVFVVSAPTAEPEEKAPAAPSSDGDAPAAVVRRPRRRRAAGRPAGPPVDAQV